MPRSVPLLGTPSPACWNKHSIAFQACVRLLTQRCAAAAGMAAASCAQRVGKVYDQYLSFIALEAGLFSLGLPNTYLQLNDPAARDTQIAARPRCTP